MLETLSINALEILRWVVFALFIVSAIAVTSGVYWEKEEFPHRVRHCGWKLLVWSLGAEILLTIGVFVIDGTISIKQRHTIEQILVHRHLSPEQKDRLAAVAKEFPSLNFLTITALDAESWDFVMEIAAVLKSNGWNWIPCDGPLPKLIPQGDRPPSCWTVLDHIQIDGSQNLTEVVHSLETALRNPAIIGMDDVRPEISPAFPTTAIMVGTKR